MKAIKEKKLENQYNLKQKETAHAIQNIKKAALHEVQLRRNNLKMEIEQMRSKQKRKQMELNQKLHTVKLNMAQQMKKAYKKGDFTHCVNIENGKDIKQKKEVRKNYCVLNFSDDYISYQNCLDGEDFCHLCCDNEFGEFFVDEREECYSKSCKNYVNQFQNNAQSKTSGSWLLK